MNIANKITLFRVFLIPIFVITMYIGGPNASLYAGIIFIIASLTDAIDGHLARSKNLITDFGKFMDPLADKLLASAAMIMLVEQGKIPAWIIITIISREFIITGLRTLGASNGVTIAASKWGKMKTITQLISLTMLLFNDYISFTIGSLEIDYIILYISLFFTVLSGVDYLIKNKDVLNLSDI